MAFSGSSYFAGIATAFAGIAFGFACGSMVTTSVVRPPNRLERVNAGTTVGSNSGPVRQVSPSVAEKPDPTKPPAQNVPPSAVAATTAAPASDPQPVQRPQPTAPAAVKSNVATGAQPQPALASTAGKPAPAVPAPVANSEDAASAKEDTAAAKNERASARSAEPNREISHRRTQRKSSDDRRFSERKRRQDEDPRQQNLDAAANVVRQMPRERAVDDVVEQDDGPRFGMRPRHFESVGDDDLPRRVNGPPSGFGFFGFGD